MESATDESAPSTQAARDDMLSHLNRCGCRCHQLELNAIPPSLTAYLGQLIISQRATFMPCISCTCWAVQHHRVGVQTPVTVKWLLPSGLLPIHLQLSLSTPVIDLSIDMQGEASDDSPVWAFIRKVCTSLDMDTHIDETGEENDPWSTAPGGFPQA